MTAPAHPTATQRRRRSDLREGIGVGVAAEAFGLRAAGIGFSAIVAGLAVTALMSLARRS